MAFGLGAESARDWKYCSTSERIFQLGSQEHALGPQECLESKCQRSAIGILFDRFLGSGDAAFQERIPLRPLLFAKCAVTSEPIGLRTLEFGNLEHRVTGLRAFRILFDELAVSSEPVSGLPALI